MGAPEVELQMPLNCQPPMTWRAELLLPNGISQTPIEDEPMRLVEDQPSVVGSQVIGVLRPDIAERRAAREIVLRVPQSLAPGCSSC